MLKCLNDSQLREQMYVLSRHSTTEALALKTLLFTGAREAELCQLKKKDLSTCAIYITAVKGSSNRLVPVHREFFDELSNHFKHLQNDDLLFPVTTRTIRNWWDVYKVVHLGAHSLRHTFGVRFYANCRDIHATKTVLGHKQISNTIIYLEFVESLKTLREGTKGMWDGNIFNK